MDVLIEIVGWIGTACILGTYFATQFKFMQQHGYLYQFLNLIGAVFIMINSYHHSTYANAFLNVIWAIIALVALANLMRHTSSNRTS